MAKTSSVGIDIGNNQLKVVQLKKTSSGVRIEKFFVEDYGLTSSELESSEVRLKAVTQILGRIFKDLKPANVVFVITKYEENIRTLSLPLMTEKQLREALKLGGQQDYIPFDLKEMIWDINISNFYRRKEDIRVEGKEKMDVIFAVAKRQVVNSYLDIAEKLKFSVDVLESNTLSNLNYSIFNLVIPKNRIWSKIDIGAETTSVNVLEGDSLKFSLNIPWGVNDLIDSVQTVFSKDWKSAKEIISKIDFSADPANIDEENKKIVISLENKLKDFLRQLNGAFSFFESKSAGKNIAEIIISGGGSLLINFDKFLGGKLNRPVKIENEINKNVISFDKNQEGALRAAMPLLGTAIGAALRNLTLVRNSINLLPLEIIIGRRLRSRRSLIITIAAGVFLIFIGLMSVKITQLTEITKELDSIKKQLSNESAETKELRKMDTANTVFSSVRKRNDVVVKKWSNVLYELITITPKKMWFEYTEWSDAGFHSSGSCSADVVSNFVTDGDASQNFKRMTSNTTPHPLDPDSGSILRFEASYRTKVVNLRQNNRTAPRNQTTQEGGVH